MSKVQEALKAMQTLESLKTAAIEELLEQRKEIDNQLAQLGYNESPKSAPKGKASRVKDPNKPCPICKFVTEPAHDGRAHKNKQKKPAPFTDEELTKHGFTKRKAASA